MCSKFFLEMRSVHQGRRCLFSGRQVGYFPFMKICHFGMLLALAVVVSSCSGGFGQRWREAAKSSNASGIEGRWDGTWRSESNGHTGRLRCIVSPTQQANVYKFHYGGTFAKVIGFQYTVDHAVQRLGRTWTMEGKSDLGSMGGLFSYEATVQDGVFRATYRSKEDRGGFDMKRP
jgi:hypothetical protein